MSSRFSQWSRWRQVVAAGCLFLCCLTPAAAFAADVTTIKKEIDSINSQVNQKKSSLSEMNRQIEQYRDLIAEKRLESQSIEDQVALLDNRIARQQLSIDIAAGEIRSLSLEVELLNQRINEHEATIGHERQLLGNLARQLHRANFNRSALELLVAHDSLSEFFDALHSLSRLQLAVDASLKRVQTMRQQLSDERGEREGKLQQVQERKRQLEVARLAIEDEKAFKQELLNETKSSELRYRYLLADLKHEQAEADAEISNLEKVLREKMSLAERLANSVSVLAWPVEPTRGISSIFHDPDYPFRNVFEHSAIDIRAYQGTAVRAAAAGVVARAKNAGMGYSYVMLLHGSDLATVYGHLSRIIAKEDTYVERGEVIGYSGGMPGTPGAGRMTTGPHLHFEVRRGGVPVNPMNYLVAL